MAEQLKEKTKKGFRDFALWLIKEIAKYYLYIFLALPLGGIIYAWHSFVHAITNILHTPPWSWQTTEVYLVLVLLLTFLSSCLLLGYFSRGHKISAQQTEEKTKSGSYKTPLGAVDNTQAELSPTDKYRLVQEVSKHINTEKLKNLSRSEKLTLREFTARDAKTHILSIFDPDARGLASEGILRILGDYPDYKAMYKIEEWAWKMLKENPKYLE